MPISLRAQRINQLFLRVNQFDEFPQDFKSNLKRNYLNFQYNYKRNFLKLNVFYYEIKGKPNLITISLNSKNQIHAPI